MNLFSERTTLFLTIWCRRVLILLTGLYLVLLIADFSYSQWVNAKVRAWESGQTYDAAGVREGCQAYTRGNGQDAVLFVHGFNDSPRLWDHFADRLVEQGYTCRSMRLPGFAMHTAQYATADLDQWILALDEEVRALRANHRFVHIVAHSLGGAIVLQSELLKPGRVDTINLVAPAIEVSNARSPILTVEQWHFVGRIALIFTRTTYNPFTPDIKDPNAADYPWRVPATPRSIIDETFRTIAKNRGRAKEITAPLFVAISQQDQVVDADKTREFYDQLGAKVKKWQPADRSGHLIPLDLDRDAVVDSMREFWKACEPVLLSRRTVAVADDGNGPK